MRKAVELTDEDFYQTLWANVGSGKVFVMGFYTVSTPEWIRTLDAYAKAHPDIATYKISGEKSPEAMRFIQGKNPAPGPIPYVTASLGGSYVARAQVMSKKELEDFVEGAPDEMARERQEAIQKRKDAEKEAMASSHAAITVNEENFEAEVVNSDKPVLIDFWADWCSPCHALAPTFEKFAAANPDVKSVKIDIDANPALAKRFNIRSIPALVVVQDGQEVGRSHNDRTVDKIKTFVKGAIAKK